MGPPLAIALLFLVPFVTGHRRKSWKRRPVAVLSVILIVLTVTTLAAWLGVVGPRVSGGGALERACDSVQYVHEDTLELQGALVLQNKQCRNCHGMGGEGGKRGPALDGVANG